MFTLRYLEKYWVQCVCVYIPIFVTTFPEWLSGTEPSPHTSAPSSLCCSVFVHMYSFAGLIRRTPPPTFSDTAITDRHPDTTIFQLRAHGHVPPVGVETLTSCVQGEHPIHKARLSAGFRYLILPFIVHLGL